VRKEAAHLLKKGNLKSILGKRTEIGVETGMIQEMMNTKHLKIVKRSEEEMKMIRNLEQRTEKPLILIQSKNNKVNRRQEKTLEQVIPLDLDGESIDKNIPSGLG
jgi:ribosome-binding ATPase YchF (GTP1/OBG family)